MKHCRLAHTKGNPEIVYRDGFFQFISSKGLQEASQLQQLNTKIRMGHRSFQLDHVAICLKDFQAWQNKIVAMIDLGGELVEGPGIFPIDFCEVAMPNDLNMRFATVVMPVSQLTLVFATSVKPGDNISRFIRKQGEAIHHVAVRSEDFPKSVAELSRLGFLTLSASIDDGDLKQQFLRNPHGQVVELISRQSEVGTFTCGNIAQLRFSEDKKAA